MQNNVGPQIRLIAFAERPAQGVTAPTQLHVYILNESPSALWILNDLDSINIPQNPPQGGQTVPDPNSTHVDFGVSESATFIQVAQGECVKVTLLLREEELALLSRVRQMEAPVKFRAGGDEQAEVTTALLPAAVYKTNP